jgi:hypothetical protein
LKNKDNKKIGIFHEFPSLPGKRGERLARLRDEIGFDGILAKLNCGGLIPHAPVLNAIGLLCREVVPRFH